MDPEGGDAAVRPEIALSWKRSALSGLRPDIVPDPRPDPDTDLSSRLMEAAAPVLDEVRREIADTGFGVLLADSECRIVARIVDGTHLNRLMSHAGAELGSRFGEDRVGTTALGTPMEVRRGVAIHGTEHYLEQFKLLSCYGHPIVHPVTRRVEGVLDMTSISDRANPLFGPFLARAANDIERRLLEGSRISQQRLVEAFQRQTAESRFAVAALGEDLQLSNRSAADLLDISDLATLEALAADLSPGQSRTLGVELASGSPVLVRAERVTGTSGTVFVLESSGRRIVPRGGEPASLWNRTRATLTRLRDSAGAVAVTGEAGSGRSTAVRDLTGDRSASVLDATDIALDGLENWVQRLQRIVQTSPDVLALEEVQLLPEALLPVVAKLIDTSHPRVILTSAPVETVPAPTAGLIARCPGRVTLPPLRRVTGDIGEIARAVLESVDPGLRLSPSAVDALAACEWPGNLAELRVVLEAAAGARTSDRIRDTDLPATHRGSRRIARLGGRERAERQAIVDALVAASGNKARAAAALGISRSTLYVRMKALEIR
ncbi:Fis family transcriptional regulator [Rhodococcus triatomae]|uniref:Transcriptional regulator of acetoin/glycerol metabolism n=2 Tax=Rhodococcus triatomae TaxID=300028 RepID=A0A1G8SFG6_9NOCA|nr:Fis family transcriptional regulator [Rhodococcus triatomae]QNG25670.1 Fis family transcriptional regulator [Rhodococcus triatomae]SDJ27917.1 Transcriptional regulator of acetoin/glycerol metabolism [Rhodococcus triatomae]